MEIGDDLFLTTPEVAQVDPFCVTVSVKMWYPSRDRRECMCVSGGGWQEQEGRAVTLIRSGVDESNHLISSNSIVFHSRDIQWVWSPFCSSYFLR